MTGFYLKITMDDGDGHTLGEWRMVKESELTNATAMLEACRERNVLARDLKANRAALAGLRLAVLTQTGELECSGGRARPCYQTATDDAPEMCASCSVRVELLDALARFNPREGA